MNKHGQIVTLRVTPPRGPPQRPGRWTWEFGLRTPDLGPTIMLSFSKDGEYISLYAGEYRSEIWRMTFNTGS